MKRNGANNRARFEEETAVPRCASDSKAQDGYSGRFQNGSPFLALNSEADFEKPIPRTGTLTRTKALLLAAVRVWELKRGLRE